MVVLVAAHTEIAAGPADQYGGDRAGARSGGEGDARAALADDRVHMAAINRRRELDIGALREGGIPLDRGADHIDWHRRKVGDDDDAMGIADREDRDGVVATVPPSKRRRTSATSLPP